MARDSERAFTRIELLSVVAILMVLAGLVFPVLAQSGRASRQTVCLSNLGTVMRATTLYAAENQGLVPEAGLFNRSSDNWCYGPVNSGRLSGQPGTMPDVADVIQGREVQEPFRRLGLLWPYLLAESLYFCPDEPLLSEPGQYPVLPRRLKLSSYQANIQLNSSGETLFPLRLDQFLQDGFAFIEPHEANVLAFNDAVSEPDTTITQRHGPRLPVGVDRNAPDSGSHVATIGGAVEYISDQAYRAAIAAPRPNRGFCYRP